jgi:hypothetical protein
MKTYTISPATVERRIYLYINGHKSSTWWAPEDLEAAKAEARRLRTSLGGARVALSYSTETRPAHVVDALGYAYMCEYYAQDADSVDEYHALVAEHGEPDWSLIAADQRARRAA